MAGGGGGSNTTHALLSPDPETLPMGEVSFQVARSITMVKTIYDTSQQLQDERM